MNRLYLVRHGENLANLTLEFSCFKVDYSLTPKGVLQAEQAAVYFRGKPIHAIATSPLKRAQETAAILAAELNLPVTMIEAFREVNVGDFEGRPPTQATWDAHNAIIQDWLSGKPESRFPGGEDYHGLWQRYHQGLTQVVANIENQNIIIVGHGGLFSFTLKDLCPEADLAQLIGKGNPNSSISEILVTRSGSRLVGKLVRWASVDHLSGFAAELVSGIR